MRCRCFAQLGNCYEGFLYFRQLKMHDLFESCMVSWNQATILVFSRHFLLMPFEHRLFTVTFLTRLLPGDFKWFQT